MNFKTIMNDLIESEIAQIEQSGKKVRLNTVLKKRFKCSAIFGVLFIWFVAMNGFGWALIDLVVYFICMYRITNVSVITKMAKKSPDTLISDLIRGDMR